MFTKEQITKWTKGFEASKDVPEFLKQGAMREATLEVWMCGEWMNEQINVQSEHNGFTNEEFVDMQFAFGQRALTTRDKRALAKTMLEEFLAGYKNPLPEELAEEINDKIFGR